MPGLCLGLGLLVGVGLGLAVELSDFQHTILLWGIRSAILATAWLLVNKVSMSVGRMWLLSLVPSCHNLRLSVSSYTSHMTCGEVMSRTGIFISWTFSMQLPRRVIFDVDIIVITAPDQSVPGPWVTCWQSFLNKKWDSTLHPRSWNQYKNVGYCKPIARLYLWMMMMLVYIKFEIFISFRFLLQRLTD